MPRIQTTPTRSRETTKERRIREIREAAVASASGSVPARRGEDDDVQAAPIPVQPVESVPHEAAPAAETAVEAVISTVIQPSEEADPFRYVEPPADADPLEQIGLVRRGIARANRGLANGLGAMQKGYVQSAGEYLWWATQGDRLRRAGFRSVEAFAQPLGLTKQDVYRLRRAVPVMRAIGDMIEEALNERTIRELYKTLTNEKDDLDATPERCQNLRAQFAEMKSMGRVNSGGAVAARRLLLLGGAADAIEGEPEEAQKPTAMELLNKSWCSQKVVDLEVLRKAKEEDPEAVRRYVSELRERYEAAAQLVEPPQEP